MRKRFARFFLLVAKRLDPETHIENAQHIEDYEAKKIGLSYVVTKNDIKDFRFKDGARMSYREGKGFLVRETRKKIRAHIFGLIDVRHLIEYSLHDEDGGFRLSGEMKVYVPKVEE